MNKQASLEINELSVSVSDAVVLQDINLLVESSSVHAIMGPNGSGKSSLAYALAGHPQYTITTGNVTLKNDDLLALAPHERARKGLFLSFQNPCEIPGVSVLSFFKEAYAAIKGIQGSMSDFNNLLTERCMQLGIDPLFLMRGVNQGFSGGEKKRLELLQMLVLQPDVVILDEIDSGLDIDALKSVAAGIERARKESPHMSIVLITHYRRILDYITPDHVHVLSQGSFVASGDYSLVTTLETEGYDVFKK